MDCSKIETLPEGQRVMVYRARVTSLLPFIDPNIPWVWILGHRPFRYIEWWSTTVPLKALSTQYTGLVRNISYDMQLPTPEFIEKAADFEDDGIILVQSNQQMPDTLCFESIPETHQRKVLVQNGATLRLWLPHAGESAMVESFVVGHLAHIIGNCQL